MYFFSCALSLLLAVLLSGPLFAQQGTSEDISPASSSPRRIAPVLQIYNGSDETFETYCSVNISTVRVFDAIHHVDNLHFSPLTLPARENKEPLILDLGDLDISGGPSLIVEFYLHDTRTRQVIFRAPFTYAQIGPHFSKLVLTLRSLTQMDAHFL